MAEREHIPLGGLRLKPALEETIFSTVAVGTDGTDTAGIAVDAAIELALNRVDLLAGSGASRR